MAASPQGQYIDREALQQGERSWRAQLQEALEAQRSLLDTVSSTLEGNAALCDVVTELPQRTSHRVMVPLGRRAFMPGRLVHTNELLVHLGGQTYAERTAAQTAAILARRMETLEGEAARCREEVQRLEQQLSVGADVAVNEAGLIEIQETYDEAVHGRAASATVPSQPAAILMSDAKQRATQAEPDDDELDAMLARMEALEVMEARSGELAGAEASGRGGDGGGGGDDTAAASREGTEAEGLPPGWKYMPRNSAVEDEAEEGIDTEEADSDDDPDFVAELQGSGRPPEVPAPSPRSTGGGKSAPKGILKKGFLTSPAAKSTAPTVEHRRRTGAFLGGVVEREQPAPDHGAAVYGTDERSSAADGHSHRTTQVAELKPDERHSSSTSAQQQPARVSRFKQMRRGG